MAIEYAGGTLDVRTVVVGAVCVTDLVNTIAASCLAAGWTVTDLTQFAVLSGSNNTNGQTVTIGGQVYTFNTVLGGANSVLLGSTALQSLQNLKAAINGAAGVGTIYGVGTTANASVTCAFANVTTTGFGLSGSSLMVYTKSALGVAVTAAGNFAWSTATLTSKLYRMVSVETPGHQQVFTYIGAAPQTPATILHMYVMNRDQTTGCGQLTNRSISNGQTYQVVAHRYGFHSYPVGVYGTSATGIYLQAPYLPVNLAPAKIIDATNATPIVIETDQAHGYVTGDSVLHKYIEGNTAANGTWLVTYIDATHYSLDTSVGNGAFTGTKGLAKNVTPPRRQMLEFILGNFGGTSDNEWTTGSLYYFGTGAGRIAFFGISDGAPFINEATFEGFFPIAAYTNGAGVNTKYVWASGAFVALEPFLVFATAYGGSAAGPQLYNAAIAQSTAVPGGATATFDGHNWYGVYNNDGRAQLLLALS